MFHPEGPTVRELAVQALSSTERGYDLLASKFDYTPFRTPDPVLEVVAASLSAGAPFQAGLDLCCGTGAGMRMLRPLCGERVVGVDFSRGMLSVGRRRRAGAQGGAQGGAQLEWVRGNVLDLPFGTVFDVAVCFGALGHILERDQPRFVAEVARVLRPGGRFVFVTSPEPPVISARYWLALGFDSAMRLRNRLWSPPFVMYYLTFMLPGVRSLLEQAGLTVEVRRLDGLAGLRGDLRLVTATKARPAVD